MTEMTQTTSSQLDDCRVIKLNKKILYKWKLYERTPLENDGGKH